jgi:oligoendopeptidase F
MNLILPTRSELAPEETWALEHLFASRAEAEDALAVVAAEVATLAARQGRLAENPGALLETLDALESLARRRARLSNYFRLPVTTDQGNAEARALAGRYQALATGWMRALAFVEPELLAAEIGDLTPLFRVEARLVEYAPFLARLEERRPHVRSPEVEAVLASAEGVFGAYERARDALAEGNLRFAPVPTPGGERELAPSSYAKLLHDADRDVRRAAFERWTDGYLSVADTLAETYLGRVRRTAFDAEVRAYPSGEEAALADHHATAAVLDATLEAFEKRLPVWHRYWAARRRLLGVDRHEPWDVFAPPPTLAVQVSYQDAADWITSAAAPLGEAFTSVLRAGMLEGRWVDRRPNRGKRQGAFCAFAPDVHPYVFVSYSDDLSSASTLAHEMGHAMHAVLADARVPALDSWALSMTVAETASNGLQALLRSYLMAHPRAADPDFEIALLDEAFGNLHRYLFVMPTLVRFERAVHAAVGRNEPLSAEMLTEMLAGLFAEAYGPEVASSWDAATRARVGIAWAEFPHLYAPFYTFQYTVGIAVALAHVERIVAGEPGAAETYLDFQSQGGSLKPVELFARLGFDVTTPAPVDAAFDVVERFVERLEAHATRLLR